jgi:hypothetical protein
MTNTPATFRQADLQRAIRAALKESHDLRVRITRAGEIIVERAPESDSLLTPALDDTAAFRL